MEHARSFAAAAKPAQPGVVASSVYVGGKRVGDIPIEEAGAWAAKDGHVVWIGLLDRAVAPTLSSRRPRLAPCSSSSTPPVPPPRSSAARISEM